MDDYGRSTLTPLAELVERKHRSLGKLNPYDERFRALTARLMRLLMVPNLQQDVHQLILQFGGPSNPLLRPMDGPVPLELAQMMENLVAQLEARCKSRENKEGQSAVEKVRELADECKLQRSWLAEKHRVLHEVFLLLRGQETAFNEQRNTSLPHALEELLAKLDEIFEQPKPGHDTIKGYLRLAEATFDDPGYRSYLLASLSANEREELHEGLTELEVKLAGLELVEDFHS